MSKKVQDIIEKVRSGVCKFEFLDGAGNIMNSGSGFVYNKQLITNNHVFHPDGHVFSENTQIRIIFGNDDIYNLQLSDLRLIIGSEEASADYAVFKTTAFDFENRYSFELSDTTDIRDGDEILLIGFPFETKYLTTHHGRISAFFQENGVNKIQVDASVNQGNSGGPLIHLDSGKVVGIVTRKQTGLTRDFDEMITAMEQNIEILGKTGGMIASFGGVDLIQAFRSIQAQMLRVSVNIKRSANTGIGYAFSCEKLIADLGR